MTEWRLRRLRWHSEGCNSILTAGTGGISPHIIDHGHGIQRYLGGSIHTVDTYWTWQRMRDDEVVCCVGSVEIQIENVTRFFTAEILPDKGLSLESFIGNPEKCSRRLRIRFPSGARTETFLCVCDKTWDWVENQFAIKLPSWKSI